MTIRSTRTAIHNLLAPKPAQRGTSAPAQKTVIAAGGQRVGVQDRPAPMTADADSIAQASRNELVYACLKARADAVIDPQIVLEERQSDNSYAPMFGHPLMRLLQMPADDCDQAGWFAAGQVSRDISGIFLSEKLFSPSGAVVGLNPLNPTLTKPIIKTVGSRQVVTSYEWRDGGDRQVFDLDQLLIWKQRHWVRPPPLHVALGSVDADSAATDYVRAFFNNAGVPAGIVNVKGSIDQEIADTLRARWRALYGRATGLQHDIAVLDNDSSYEKIGSSLNELESETVRGVNESRISMAFGVPPLIIYAYVGLLRATYSNLKEAYSGFWDLTVGPLLTEWLSWLSMSLLPLFEDRERILDGQIRLRWDFSGVSALQEDVDAAQTRARENFRAGGVTLNEYRAVLGLPPDANGDYYLRLLSYAPAYAGDAPQATADDILDGKALGRKVRAAMRSIKAESVEAVEDRLAQEVAAYLKGQYVQAAERISP